MRFKQIVENSTTAGSVASVAKPMMTQTRENTNVRGLKPVQQVIKGKAVKKGPYANSIVESKVTEDDLAEQDLIVIPGQGRLRRTGFVKHDMDQGEHEGETLKNSLHTIARAASELDKRLSVQSEFPEWVSEKIGAAKGMMVTVMDYLISSQEMQHDSDAMEGVAEGGYQDDSKEREENLRYSRSRNPVADAIRKKLNPNQKPEKEQGVAEAGDTAKGQKMLAKVHQRAADRVTSKQADKDPAYARKAQQTQDRAWDRLAVKEQGVAEGSIKDVEAKIRTHDQRKADREQAGDPYVAHEIHSHNVIRKQLLDKRKRAQAAYHKKMDSEGVAEGVDAAWDAAKKKVNEGAKVDRMVKHVKKSEKKLGHSDKEAENIAWATANKRGMLDNKNKKK